MASVLLQREGRVAVVTLNAPQRRNALDAEMVAQINRIFDEIEADPGVGAVVLTGAGSAFCAGADINVLLSADIAVFRQVYEGFLRILRCPLPVVAAVNGPATGAGLNIAMACDVRLVSEDALFVSRFLDIGLHPGGGHSWLLTRLGGTDWARALILFGDELTGKEAVTAGLALRCVEGTELLAKATSLAQRAANVPLALQKRAKETLNLVATLPDHASALAAETEAQAWSAQQPWLFDRIEQIRQKISAKR